MAEDKKNQNGLNEMEKILKQCEVGRLSLCDGSMPYSVPLNFLYHEKKITFHCSWEGKKLDLIRKNPNCCFEVDNFAGETGYHYKNRCHLDYDSVLAFGKAHEEKNIEEKTGLIQLFSEKYDEIYRKSPSEGGKIFVKERVSECCCVIINVHRLTGRRERIVEEKRKKTIWDCRF